MVFAGATVVCCAAADGKETDSGCGRGWRKGWRGAVGVLPVAAGPFAVLLRVGHEEPQKEQARYDLFSYLAGR